MTFGPKDAQIGYHVRENAEARDRATRLSADLGRSIEWLAEVRKLLGKPNCRDELLAKLKQQRLDAPTGRIVGDLDAQLAELVKALEAHQRHRQALGRLINLDLYKP